MRHFILPAAFMASLWTAPMTAGAVEVPPAGKCPPYPVKTGTGDPAPFEDVPPPAFKMGEKIPLEGLSRLRNYLPREIWDKREVFFFEGMVLEIGPCHRRFPLPAFFEQASEANAKTARLEDEGNLAGYSGTGLPFPWQQIDDADPEAGWKWAWNYRYRYQGAGYRGDFRIHHVSRRGRKVERFTGDFFFLPMHGVPGESRASLNDRFWAGGRFFTPPISRSVAWRQAHSSRADREPDRSDDVWVYLPDNRRVRRAPPTSIDGLYLPSHERGNLPGNIRVNVPGVVETPDASISATEHTRRGLTGLLLRPNAYRFGFVRAQDVIAPINSRNYGYPTVKDRNFGPSGLSLAHDTWDIRRAVVLKGVRKKVEGRIASVTLYIDALTQQPLYFISRKANNHLAEVGMFLGRFSGEDPLHPKWEGSGKGFGTILPAAASFFVSGEGGWLRESFELRSDPPTDEQRANQASTIKLQRGR